MHRTQCCYNVYPEGIFLYCIQTTAHAVQQHCVSLTYWCVHANVTCQHTLHPKTARVAHPNVQCRIHTHVYTPLANKHWRKQRHWTVAEFPIRQMLYSQWRSQLGPVDWSNTCSSHNCSKHLYTHLILTHHNQMLLDLHVYWHWWLLYLSRRSWYCSLHSSKWCCWSSWYLLVEPHWH